MDLDALYGPNRAASSVVHAHELRTRPRSRVELTVESAVSITRFLDVSPGRVTSVFAEAYHLLWIMDQSARVFIAVEEVLDAEDRSIAALPLAVQARPAGAIKLGHPSFIEDSDRHARIGGEIIYDPEWDSGADWILTNKSGRYGLRSWQTEDHLRAAHGLFSIKGLHLGMRFLIPRA